MPTVGSLFSGIGGLDLGLERAGWTVKWQVEIDPYCSAVLAKHWPDVTRYGDIRELTGEEIEPVDLICGGFPCPPVSRVGKRLGRSDPRWLWPDFARILRVVRPRIALVENVPGLLDGALAEVLGDLDEMGFHTERGCVPACAFGAPHPRERVFVLAYTDPPGRAHTPRRPRSSGSAWRKVFATIPARPRIHHWSSEPALGRVVHGIPGWMVERLGDSVVPQVAEYVGRQILEAWEEY